MDDVTSLVHGIVQRHCPANLDREEVASDCIAHVMASLDQFDARRAKFSTFVGMVTRRRIIDIMRRLETRQRRETAYAQRRDSITHGGIDASESRLVLVDLIIKSNMTLRQRVALQMHEGIECPAMSYREIGRLLGFTRGNVFHLKRKALLRLRRAAKNN